MEKVGYINTLNKLLKIFVYAFALNLIWENIHSTLYFLPSGDPITQWMLLRATFFDALFIASMGVVFLLMPYFRRHLWYSLVFGFMVAVIVEWQALNAGDWAYKQTMPILPILNTGLTPTIQLGLLAYVVYILADMNMNQKKSKNPEVV